jgi:AraC-like DNA-binding protein
LRDGERKLAPGEAVIVAPRRSYLAGLHDEPGSRSHVLIWVWKTPPLIAEARPAPDGHLLCRMTDAACERLKSAHAACRRELENPDKFVGKIIHGLRLEIDVELARQALQTPATTTRQLLVESAVRWMRQHLHHNNAVFLVCDYLQVSRPTLNRAFAEILAVSPSSYYQRLRMQKARELLERRKLTVKEAAFELGYRHPNDFSRAYRVFLARK